MNEEGGEIGRIGFWGFYVVLLVFIVVSFMLGLFGRYEVEETVAFC